MDRTRKDQETRMSKVAVQDSSKQKKQNYPRVERQRDARKDRTQFRKTTLHSYSQFKVIGMVLYFVCEIFCCVTLTQTEMDGCFEFFRRL